MYIQNTIHIHMYLFMYYVLCIMYYVLVIWH